MNLIIDNEYSFDFDLYELSSLLLQRVLELEQLELDAEINILIADDAEIHRVNKEFRGMDKATDVLSFPAITFERAADFSGIDLEDEGYYNPDTGGLILGDMMLSYDRILAQAQEYGHSVRREYSFLIVHSMLHLLGYDHEKKEDEIIMREKQAAVLDSLDIRR